MPNRMMRESALTSPTLDALSAGAECFFWRLILNADDYGRFDADPRILAAGCFPRRVGRLKLAQIEAWRAELVAVGTIRLYEVKGRLYGYFVAWDKHQRVRTKRSKFPDPPDGGGDFPTVGPQRQIPAELRRLVRERDRVCLACGAPDNLVLDHIVPVDQGGLGVAENLQLLCYDCNAAKRTQTLDFRNPGEAERQFVATRRSLRPSAADGSDMSPRARSRNPAGSGIQPETEPGGAGGTAPAEPAPPAPSGGANGSGRRHRLPDEAELTDADEAYAKAKGFDDAEIDRMFEAFCDHHWAKGTLMLDWSAAWRTWVRRELTYRARSATRGAHP